MGLHLQFNCVLATFYLFLPCPICQKNYEALNPVQSLCIPIFKTNDATSMIYELHNQVNLHKQAPSDVFELDKFLERYHLNVDREEVVTLDIQMEI